MTNASLLGVETPADRVALVTLRRPERRNALSIALRDAVSDTLDTLAADEAVSVVVITGEGPVFCAGFDLKEFETAATDPAFDRAICASRPPRPCFRIRNSHGATSSIRLSTNSSAGRSRVNWCSRGARSAPTRRSNCASCRASSRPKPLSKSRSITRT